jgi:dihydroneopterin aldolase
MTVHRLKPTARIADAVAGLRHVFVRDLDVASRIGVHAHERAAPQRVRVNLDLAVEDAPPANDQLREVVDYDAVVEAVRRVAGGDHVQLVETLAERIAEACFVDHRVVSARVRVEKLDVFPDCSAGIEIERLRPPSRGGA